MQIVNTSAKRKFDAPTLFLARHAQTAWNTGDPATDRAKGVKNDLPITDQGRKAAEADARALAAYDIAEVHRSKMLRSKQTVAPIVAATGASEHVNDALDPWDVGYLSGQLREQVAERVDYYIAHPRRAIPDGEPYGDFWKRITEAFATLLKRAEELEDRAVLVSSHSDGIEALEAWLKGTLPEAHTVGNSISPASILKYTKRGGKWTGREWTGGKGEPEDE